MFALNKQLEEDCIELGQFELCKLLLMNDSSYPWFILVPEREGMTELYELNDEDQLLLLKESNYLAQILKHYFHADKINIAALGNVVPQLHIHHIARYTEDRSWPAPVWGKHDALPYTEEQLDKIFDVISKAMADGNTISEE
ncbi:MAG: HIT domain-containing protein [Gammaproteobacteria bacterium]|nr:HIT domain-containing protein [Gammaproteobacteria bacterium]